MKPTMLAFAIMLAFAVATTSEVLAQDEGEDEDFDIFQCASMAGYGTCEFKCRQQYEDCLREAANIDENQCRDGFDNCIRICRLAHCEE